MASTIVKKIRQLEQYILQLRDTDDQRSDSEHAEDYSNYLMPSDIACPEDWAEFDNVYQFHGPKFFLTDSTRDVSSKHNSRANLI